MVRTPLLLMSKGITRKSSSSSCSRAACARALALIAMLATLIACSSSGPAADAGASGGDAGAPDAATDNQLREDTCTYWPLDSDPPCGEALYGSALACIEAIEPCEDRELLGTGYCWESADERCDPSCLPDCAEAP